ncbi:MAG: plasminogen-binding N-terminal domain-containing protein [Sulfurimonas sp.]|jgi:hypothetical protein|nr:plasminogen-binding N-terminal domain-containing protein [Sulfurimonadaceae bacterium]
MKSLILLSVFVFSLYANIIKAPITSVDLKTKTATIEVSDLKKGMFGYLVHKLENGNTIILNTATILSYDPKTKQSKVSIDEFDMFNSDSLPTSDWSIVEGDEAIFAFGYDKALLIAPTEDIYYRISEAANVTWVHPDIFATILSRNGHPTPLRSDFAQFADETLTGIVFLYLNSRVYTLDAKTFKILAISEAKISQGKAMLPFYSRVEEIEAAWWGEGSSRLSKYEPYYYELLIKANKDNKELFDIVSSSNKRSINSLLEYFDFKGDGRDKKRFFGLF